MTDLENIMSFYSYCMHCELERKQLLKIELKIGYYIHVSCSLTFQLKKNPFDVCSEQREMDKNIGSKKLKNSKHA